MTVRTKRIYDHPSDADGTRILIDRLWPRGLKKKDARIDHWLKEVAPSTELRKWFGHDPAKWADFQKRYRAELQDNPALAELIEVAREGDITLVYAAKDQVHNHAVVLRKILEEGD